MIKEAVVLASGFGNRLRKLTGNIPKVFYKVMGIELVKYPMFSLINAGVERFIIVLPKGFKNTGYELLKEMEIDGCVVENNNIPLGNAYSFMITEGHTSERFFLTCGDSLYTSEAILKMKEDRVDAHIKLAVSKIDRYIDVDEASKVLLGEDKRILKIGKRLKQYTHYDTGLFIMTSEVYKIKKHVNWNQEVSLYEILQKAIDLGFYVKGVDIGSTPWMEIDTIEDMRMALKDGKKILETILEGSKWRGKIQMGSSQDI